MQTTEYFTCSIRLLHSALIGTLLSFAANSSGLALGRRPIWQVGDILTFRVTNGPLTSRPGYLTATRQDVIREARDGGYVMESTDVESDGTRKAPRKLQFTLDMNRLFKVSGQSDLVEAKMSAFPMQSGARWEADFPLSGRSPLGSGSRRTRVHYRPGGHVQCLQDCCEDDPHDRRRRLGWLGTQHLVRARDSPLRQAHRPWVSRYLRDRKLDGRTPCLPIALNKLPRIRCIDRSHSLIARKRICPLVGVCRLTRRLTGRAGTRIASCPHWHGPPVSLIR